MNVRILAPVGSRDRGVVEVVIDRGGRWTAKWRPPEDSAERGTVGWGLLRPGEVQRREFGLEEAALRADEGVMRFEAAQHLGAVATDSVWNARPQAVQGGRVRIELRSVALLVAERACVCAEETGIALERLLDPADVLEAAWREGGEPAVEPCVVLSVGARESVVLWLDDGARRVRSLMLGGSTTADEVAARQTPPNPSVRLPEEQARAALQRLDD